MGAHTGVRAGLGELHTLDFLCELAIPEDKVLTKT